MSTTKIISDIAAIRAAALENLLTTTDAELRQEAREDGENLDETAIQMKSAMREAAASALRERMAKSKSQSRQKLSARPPSFARPAVDRIKELVQDLFARDQSLGLAFRDGKRQSDADWQSLYDDLVAIGAIKSADDGL
ncbi:MAG: hypothetical protein Q8K22_10190 [Rhodoferax sp.]|nr:hypothetical protein [Rhodoferax sp.]